MKAPLIIILLLTGTVLHSQRPSLFFEKLTVQDGLSHNKINCIVQDSRGFIWLGTDDGLNRYDGKNFVQFRRRLNDSTSISGNIITDLHEDREGRIWIATADGGLSRYDYRLAPAQQFRQYRHFSGDPASIPGNILSSIVEDKRGYLWLGTSGHSVLRFNKKTERFENITKTNKTILDMCQDGSGMIWVGRQGGGLQKLDPTNLAYTEDARYRDLYDKDLPHVTITALFRDRENAMWFGSWDKGLYRQTPTRGREEIFRARGEYSFEDDEVLSFGEDDLGRLWIGGKEKGLQVLDRKTGRFYQYRYDPAKEGALADNRINCIFTDRQGRMWLGTNRGACISTPHKQQFVQSFFSSETGSDMTVNDFYENGDEVWLATNKGIYIRRADGSLMHYPIFFKGEALQVSCFFRDEDGSFYLGTNYSLFRYHPATHTVSMLPNTEKDTVMGRIIDSRVVSVVRYRIEGRPVLLVSPYGHFLAYYDLERKHWVSRLDTMNIIQKFNLKDNLIREFYKTRNGNLWMATSRQGLAFWGHAFVPMAVFFNQNQANAGSITSNNVYDLAEDEKGNLWVATYGGGLHYFDVRTHRFTQVAASNNLVEGLRVDHHQNVWLVSNGQLHKYDPRRNTYSTYDLPDLEKTGGIKGKIYADRRGRLYVAGSNYIIVFHPDSISETRTSPNVFLTDFRIFNRSFSHLLEQESIRLNYKDNYFAFEFSAPDFSHGSQVRYSYQLEGFDKDWVDAGERNYVSYSNLEGGEYVFRVRATNTPGSWGREYASIRISIVPPFWKRAWFYVICALAMALAVYAIYRYRINELLKRQAIRNKIAQDLHDNVGSTLSSISVYSQVARIYHQQSKECELFTTLEKISSASSEMISELNDTVWAINPRNDHMNVILQRMESFARPLLAAQEIRFQLEAGPSIASLNLEMEKRKNFYLIFKEAVHNAIKYSGCAAVRVDIRQKGMHLLMTITDDGKGFDLAKTSEGYKSSDVYGGGNGLKNMQLRAKEMKGYLKISSEAGQGTAVKLDFPIT